MSHITRQTKSIDEVILSVKLFDQLPGAVTTAIIDVEDGTCGKDLTCCDEALKELREFASRISKDRLLVVARGRRSLSGEWG